MKHDNEYFKPLYPVNPAPEKELMKFYFDSKTPHGTSRLWVTNSTATPITMSFFGIMSVWGGPDKQENGVVSWELPLGLTEEMVRNFLIKTTI